MTSDQLCGTVCDKLRVLFFLPTRGYRVLIAVNHGQLHHLLCDARYRVSFIFQRFPRFLNNPMDPAGSLQEVPPVLQKTVRDMQTPLVLQRFPCVSCLLRGIIFLPSMSRQPPDREKLALPMLSQGFPIIL